MDDRTFKEVNKNKKTAANMNRIYLVCGIYSLVFGHLF
jgi:hypothetical protein